MPARVTQPTASACHKSLGGVVVGPSEVSTRVRAYGGRVRGFVWSIKPLRTSGLLAGQPQAPGAARRCCASASLFLARPLLSSCVLAPGGDRAPLGTPVKRRQVRPSGLGSAAGNGPDSQPVVSPQPGSSLTQSIWSLRGRVGMSRCSDPPLRGFCTAHQR